MKNGIKEAKMEYIEATDIDWAAGLIPYENSSELEIWKTENWTKTLDFIKKNREKIDVFLSYLYPKQIDVNAIKEIQKLGIPCVNFYCDNVREYRKVPKEFLVFDLMWVPEYEALDMYKKTKLNFINRPMPLWIDPIHRNQTIEKNLKTTFIGTKDILRNNLLSALIKNNIPLEIYGKGWQEPEADNLNIFRAEKKSFLLNQFRFIDKFGIDGLIIKSLQKLENFKPIPIPAANLKASLIFDEYIKQTKESAITLGINRVPTFKRLRSNAITYSRLRDLEAPMLGACYLTEHTEGLNHLYDIGNEIETYSNEQELVLKCQELLSSHTKRKSLRENGQQRALNDHSIAQTLYKIKDYLFN